MRSRRLSLLLFVLGAAPAFAADPQPYTVHIGKTGQATLDAALLASSSLVSLRQKAPVSPFALISRARLDQGRLLTALQSEGYYAGFTTITINGEPIDDPSLPARLAALPKGTSASVAVNATLGPLFTLGAVQLAGTLPPSLRASFTLHQGAPAAAAAVLAAGTGLLKTLQDHGYALAEVPPPVAIEHSDTHTIDVTYTVTTGPQVDLGPITLAGLKRVSPRFVKRELLVHQGERYNPDQIEAARQALAALPVFAAVQARAAHATDADGQLPLTFNVTEALRYVVSLNAAYSTDLGASLGASWTDRNLFGAGQQLILSAAATELGGSDASQPGYDLTATLLTPDWLRRGQSLQYDAIAVRQYLLTYNRTAETLDTIVTRTLSKTLVVSAGVSGTEELVAQEGVNRNYVYVGLPLSAKFDTTDSLLTPTHGVRLSATVTPTESLGGSFGSATYVLLNGTGSTYINLGPPGRSVLALRATLGAAEGATAFALPPDQRFYAGGSATIRGYQYQYVGPEFANGIPQGGTSLDAATIEFRQRFGQHYGAALFVDGGQVGTTGVPFNGAFRAGAGIGARYYTAIGPIRLDLAVPLIPQRGAGSFEAYIGIGEAF